MRLNGKGTFAFSISRGTHDINTIFAFYLTKLLKLFGHMVYLWFI